MSQYTNGNRINAYTALNVATDIISHQEEYKSLTGFLFNVRGYFTRPADWIQDFVQAIKKPEFALHEYLHPTMENLKTIEMETGFEWCLN